MLEMTGEPIRLLGVVNVTPDSFSDGGRYLDADAAISHGLALARDGADLVDVGGESTRPGAAPVDVDEELRRVLPVVRALAQEGVGVSIDTQHARTAVAAVEAGARLVNDVSGGLADPAMAAAVADLPVPYVAMHWRGPSDAMDALARYDDPAAEVRAELARRVDALTGQGIPRARIVVDPGIGFAKTAEHNWAVLGALDALVADGMPVLLGVSRKRFLAALLPSGAPAAARDVPTHAIGVAAARAGVWGLRVHDVVGARAALAADAALSAGRLAADAAPSAGGVAPVGRASVGSRA